MHVKRIHPGSLSGIYPRVDCIDIEPELGAAKPEVLCCAHELEEARETESQRRQEQDLDLLEKRGSDLEKERFQLRAKPSEPKPAKVGKCDCWSDLSRQQLQLPINIT